MAEDEKPAAEDQTDVRNITHEITLGVTSMGMIIQNSKTKPLLSGSETRKISTLLTHTLGHIGRFRAIEFKNNDEDIGAILEVKEGLLKLYTLCVNIVQERVPTGTDIEFHVDYAELKKGSSMMGISNEIFVIADKTHYEINMLQKILHRITGGRRLTDNVLNISNGFSITNITSVMLSGTPQEKANLIYRLGKRELIREQAEALLESYLSEKNVNVKIMLEELIKNKVPTKLIMKYVEKNNLDKNKLIRCFKTGEAPAMEANEEVWPKPSTLLIGRPISEGKDIDLGIEEDARQFQSPVQRAFAGLVRALSSSKDDEEAKEWEPDKEQLENAKKPRKKGKLGKALTRFKRFISRDITNKEFDLNAPDDEAVTPWEDAVRQDERPSARTDIPILPPSIMPAKSAADKNTHNANPKGSILAGAEADKDAAQSPSAAETHAIPAVSQVQSGMPEKIGSSELPRVSEVQKGNAELQGMRNDLESLVAKVESLSKEVSAIAPRMIRVREGDVDRMISLSDDAVLLLGNLDSVRSNIDSVGKEIMSLVKRVSDAEEQVKNMLIPQVNGLELNISMAKKQPVQDGIPDPGVLSDVSQPSREAANYVRSGSDTLPQGQDTSGAGQLVVDLQPTKDMSRIVGDDARVLQPEPERPKTIELNFEDFEHVEFMDPVKKGKPSSSGSADESAPHEPAEKAGAVNTGFISDGVSTAHSPPGPATDVCESHTKAKKRKISEFIMHIENKGEGAPPGFEGEHAVYTSLSHQLYNCFHEGRENCESADRMALASVKCIVGGKAMSAKMLIAVAKRNRIPFFSRERMLARISEVERELAHANREFSPHRNRAWITFKRIAAILAITAGLGAAAYGTSRIDGEKAGEYLDSASQKARQVLEILSDGKNDAVRKMETRVRNTQRLGNHIQGKANGISRRL